MNVFLHKLFARVFKRNDIRPASDPLPDRKDATTTFSTDHENEDSSASQLMPYDETLLERARTQWQFGDWKSLCRIERQQIQHHPDRAKLALLAAAGRLQIGDAQEASPYIRLALEWGTSKKLVSQVLISGVHNSLGRALSVTGDEERALQHFERAVSIGSPGSETRLLAQARTQQQAQQLGLSRNGLVPTKSPAESFKRISKEALN